ncbi:MAG: hypothetical protein QOJ66_2731 [Ilumatobacteraceae bacterium]
MARSGGLCSEIVRTRRATAVIFAGLVFSACGVANVGVVATESHRDAGTSTADTTVGASAGGVGPGETTAPSETTEPTGTSPGVTVGTGTPAPGTVVGVPANQDVIDFGSSKTPRAYDGFLIAAFSDIEKFWATEFPITYGGTFTPLAKGVFAAYKSRKEPIPGCGTAQTTYADVEGNGFYCSQGDFIVYDDDNLLPQLVDSLGESAVGIVLAHEFGHGIQERANELGQPTILKEQQADCFAGAWAAHVARGEASGLKFGDAEIRQGLIAMIQVRDAIDGAGIADPNAHGSGFDRVGAFQDGFNGGPGRCKTFFTENREKNLIDIQFDPTDVNHGNLPVRDPTGNNVDIVTLVPKDLNRFWSAEMSTRAVTFTPPTLQLYPQAGPFPKCDGVSEKLFPSNVLYCKATNQVLVDQDFVEKLDADPLFGDLSSGYLIGEAYSEAIQIATNSQLTGKNRILLDDCYTGAWVRDDIPPLPADRDPAESIALSAGDLDEAVVTAIARSDDSSAADTRGTAFEKVDSFRSAVIGGIGACKSRGG